MCPTKDSVKMMKDHLPACFVFDRFYPAKIEELMRVAEQNIEKGKGKRILIVADDVLYDKKSFQNVAIRQLFFNGRHYQIDLILISQYVTDIGPDLRGNVDYVFVFKDNVYSNRQKLYKMFFGNFGHFDDFQAVMDRCTQNFECLVLDNTTQSTGLTDSVFWYKARLDLEPFRVGNSIFFKLDAMAQRSSPVAAVMPEEEGAKKRLTVIKEEEEDIR